jgi:hypothetical protein
MRLYFYEVYIPSMIRCKKVGGIQLINYLLQVSPNTVTVRFSYENSTTKVGFIIVCNVGHITVFSTTHPHAILKYLGEQRQGVHRHRQRTGQEGSTRGQIQVK